MTQEWEYYMFYADIRGEEKNKKGDIERGKYSAPWVLWNTLKEKSDFQRITELGQNGWEMISAVPIESQYFENMNLGSDSGSYTRYILFTFKRPLAK